MSMKTDPVIIEERNLMLARKIMDVCHDKRAEEAAILDMRSVCDFTDFFVIATISNRIQMKSIAKEVARQMKAADARQLSRDHMQENSWVLMDYGDVVLHLFDRQAREFYCLEELWADAPRIRTGLEPGPES